MNLKDKTETIKNKKIMHHLNSSLKHILLQEEKNAGQQNVSQYSLISFTLIHLNR